MKKSTLYCLLFLLFSFVCANAQDTNVPKSVAKSSFDAIEKSQRWVNSFSNQDLVELPIGVRKDVSNTKYSIGITKATFTPQYTILQVFCKIEIPQTTPDGKPMQLFFGSDNIKLSHDGGIVGDAKLVLLGDVAIPFNNKWQLSLYGGFDMTTGAMPDLTYVTINCDGFKELKISGAVEFSREMIIPLETDGTVNESKTTVSKTYYNGQTKQIPNRVKGEFNFLVSNWNDILVNVSLQPFVLKDKRNNTNYDGNFQFLVSNAVLDLSDLKNHPTVSFPDYYQENGLLLPNENAWRGVYVETFDIGLPKEFKTTDIGTQNKRVQIGASKMIIDKYGVSGNFYADNVFPLNKGITSNQNSWGYSLDHIDITIAANTFVKANLKGEILLPVSKNKTPTMATGTTPKKLGLEYNGFISMQEQQLTVVAKDSVRFDLWKAKALLLPNSSVQLRLVNGVFLPKANLHGTLTIASNKSANENSEVEGKKTVDFKGIAFENLQLQTISPAITVGNMKCLGQVNFGNFPVSISDIGISIQDRTARIDFDLGINLMESVGAGATARIGIKGKLVEENFKQSWKYDGLDLSAIAIKCEFSGLKLNGSLILMENNPTYGNGFSADLDVDVVGVVTVHSKAIFGRTTFRYWYFDASAKWPSVPSPFMIDGFGGGAYYKMKRNPNLAVGEFSPSGLSYTPDETVNLGVKALVYFHIGKEEVCDGEAGFEVAIGPNGGINTLAIFGKAGIMAKIPGLKSVGGLMNKVVNNVNGASSFMGVSTNSLSGSFASRFIPKAKAMIPGDLSAAVGIKVANAIEFDFQNNSLHGTMNVFINTPGNFLSGTGPGGEAVDAVFHKDPNDWYLYIGTPEKRCGIRLGVGSIALTTSSYFMAGTQLPGSPAPPANVAELLGVDAGELNYMRDENSLANGGGFAFGSSLDFDTEDLSFLIFYANFKAGIGFDVMLKDYQEARCSNTGQQVGLNGWYANGQSYAYLRGELGVRVKLLFVDLKIPIITAGAAVLLQAKLPNPFWMRGYVGGSMNILGGLIKGKFRFKMTIGEQCVFENGSPLGGIKLITDVTPKKETTDVDVFAIPQATFAMKVNEAIVIPEDNGDQTYKIILEKFKVFDGTKEILGNITWSSMKDRADFISTDILPPHKPLKAVVEVSFQKLTNGVFQPLIIDGKKVIETEERNFTTGGAPNHIPLTNIDYSYPVVEQKYFLEEEYNKGYIQLKRGQDYLFDDPIWVTKVKIGETGQTNSLNATFVYNTTSNEVSYDLPNLNQSKNYSFSIISKNTQSNTTTSPTTTITDVANNGNSDTNIQVVQNNANSVSKDGEIERLSYSFATSKYKTFIIKMGAINNQNYNYWPLYPDVVILSNTISSQEAFDVIDLRGSVYTSNLPLITAQSSLHDTYFTSDINPHLYFAYPTTGKYQIKFRDITELGSPPAKALPLNTHYMTSITNEIDQNWTKENFPFSYNLPLLYKQDWIDIRNQVVNDRNNGAISTSDPAYTIINHEYTFMRFGFYDIVVKYSLPGSKKTTDFTYRFKNTNTFRQ